MGIPKNFFLLFLYIFSAFFLPAYSQIIFKELPDYELKKSDSLFFDITEKRKIISLNGTWQVYPADDEDGKKASVTIPSVFKGEGELYFEKKFRLSSSDILNYKMRLFFLGVNYTADISVNSFIIYRHTGGEFPFSLDLPKDILFSDKENLLSVKLYYKLDSETTIPVKQRFLFPQNFGGIFRDVYIHLIPNISISDLNISYNYDPKSNRAKIDFSSRIENREFNKAGDTIVYSNEFQIKISLINPDSSVKNSLTSKFQLDKNREKVISLPLEIVSPLLWSPSLPQSYVTQIELWRDEILLDKTRNLLSIYSFASEKDSLLLNGKRIQINGVTYIPSFGENGNLADYSLMENDIKLIKNTGFNSVRFAKNIPHPFYLSLCEKYGLLAFIELPVNNIPGSILSDPNFIARSRSYLTSLIKAYSKYPVFAAIGLGGSYYTASESHTAFLNDLAETAQKNSKALVYASFSNYNIPEIDNLDLYGVELFHKSILADTSEISRLRFELGSGKVFISEAGYPVNIGNTNGYVNEFSFEAQAKFFEEILDYSDAELLPGYFLNSMFDYRGDFASLIYGYSEDKIYSTGLIGEDRTTSRLSYKIIDNKLHNAERVTIPIGSSKDDSPMSFIIFGLVLAIVMGVLVNSGKKFREDSSRALLRPYNFYADIRDQRMISGVHTTILAFVVAMVAALLAANFLFYLKTSIIFEKFLLSFGSIALMNTVSYLSWNPLKALIWLSLGFFILLMLLTIIVRIGAAFVRHRVYISNVYFSVTWSFLPLVLLIPLGIILYRLLNTEVANLYVYIGILLFLLWIYYRLIKGMYVIFDVNPGGVYFYTNVVLLVIIIVFIAYFEIKNSFIDYIILTFNQYNIFG